MKSAATRSSDTQDGHLVPRRSCNSHRTTCRLTMIIASSADLQPSASSWRQPADRRCQRAVLWMGMVSISGRQTSRSRTLLMVYDSILQGICLPSHHGLLRFSHHSRYWFTLRRHGTAQERPCYDLPIVASYGRGHIPVDVLGIHAGFFKNRRAVHR